MKTSAWPGPHELKKDTLLNSTPPLVNVIIVNWNAGDLIDKCLAHLKRQTVTPDQIIVVDNGSTDYSLSILRKHPEIKLIEAGCNLGFAAANNLALSHSESEFVALLNPDAFAEPDWLEKLLLTARQNPGFVAFGSRQMMDTSRNHADGLGDAYHISGLAWRKRHARMLSKCDFESQEIFSPCAGAALYKRSVIWSLGGFDESFFCYMEDVDLGFRLRLAGYRSLYVPNAVVWHIGSAISGRGSNFSIYHGHRNLIWTYVKNMPGLLFWLFLPAHLALNLICVIHFTLKGQRDVIIKAKWDAIRGLPRIWNERKKIADARKASLISILRSLSFWKRS